MLGLFALRVRRAHSPLVEPSLFRKHAFTAGLIIAVLFSGMLAAFALILNQLTQLQLGYSPTDAGLAIAPVSVGIMIGPLGGYWFARRIGRWALQAGVAVSGVGLATLYAMLPEPTDSPWRLVPGALVVGLGMGLMIAPLFNFILAGVEDHEVGSASGVLTAIQQFGSALGVAVLGTVFVAASFALTVIAMGPRW